MELLSTDEKDIWMHQSTDIYYVLGDGDKIRDQIEFYLFSQQFDTLSIFSKKLSEAVEFISIAAKENMDAEIIMAGGDDVLFLVKKHKYHKEILSRMAGNFNSYTGNSMSFGVGLSIEQAYLNLRKAKSVGGGQVID